LCVVIRFLTMPSITHQGLVELFRARPTLALDLLRETLRCNVPDATSVEVISASVEEMVPTEHRADVMVLLRNDGASVAVVIVEIQLAVDRNKSYTWPLYVYATRNRYRCPTWLLVVAPDAEVATWALTSLSSAPGHGDWSPIVLGPNEIPLFTTAEQAEHSPELALLSAIAHGGNESAKALLEALPAALNKMPPEMLPGFLAMLYTTINPVLRTQLEKLMTTHEFADIELPPFIQNIIDIGMARGDVEGERRGKLEGKLEGKREGKLEGQARGRAESILELLELRGIEVPDAVRTEVMACTDLPTLNHWFRRAAKLKSATAVVRSRPDGAVSAHKTSK
jgi:hypothetical protein